MRKCSSRFSNFKITRPSSDDSIVDQLRRVLSNDDDEFVASLFRFWVNSESFPVRVTMLNTLISMETVLLEIFCDETNFENSSLRETSLRLIETVGSMKPRTFLRVSLGDYVDWLRYWFLVFVRFSHRSSRSFDRKEMIKISNPKEAIWLSLIDNVEIICRQIIRNEFSLFEQLRWRSDFSRNEWREWRCRFNDRRAAAGNQRWKLFSFDRRKTWTRNRFRFDRFRFGFRGKINGKFNDSLVKIKIEPKRKWKSMFRFYQQGPTKCGRFSANCSIFFSNIFNFRRVEKKNVFLTKRKFVSSF